MNKLAKIVHLHIIMMIVMSSFNGTLAIISQVFDQLNYQNLGNISVFTVFAFSGFSSIVSPYFLNRYSYKVRFIVPTICYSLFSAQGFLVAGCHDKSKIYCSDAFIYSLIIVVSAICGFLNIVFYISENEYVSEMSDDHNKGLFYGVAWAILQLCYAIGNLYSYFIIVSVGQQYYFLIMSLISLSSAFLFFTIYEPPSTQKHLNNQNKDNQQEIQKIQQKQNNLSDKTNFRSYLKEIYHFGTTDKHIIRLYPFFLSTGIVLSYMFGGISLLVSESFIGQHKTDEEINQKTFLVNIGLGVFEFIGGIMLGPIADFIGYSRAAIVSNLIFQTTLISSLYSHYLKNYPLCFVVGAFLGMSDCTGQSLSGSLISNRFGNDLKSFGLFNLMQCIAACSGTLFAILCKQIDFSIYLSILIFLQMIVNFTITNIQDKETQSQESNNDYNVINTVKQQKDLMTDCSASEQFNRKLQVNNNVDTSELYQQQF